MAALYPGRGEEQLKWKWESILKVSLHNLHWTRPEDEILCGIVKGSDTQNWPQIALELYSQSEGQFYRSGSQCWDRWSNSLDIHRKKGAWTFEEDMTLLNTLLDGERNWKEIAMKLSGRTESSVMNRWVFLLKKHESGLAAEAKKVEAISDRGEFWENHILKTLIEIKAKNNISYEQEGI